MGQEDLEFAWACGLFEGEGTLGVFGNGQGSKIATMRILMTDLEPLRRFHAAIGNLGIIDENPVKRNAPGKPIYCWRMSGTHGVKASLVTRMWPYLSERRRLQGQGILDYSERLVEKEESKLSSPPCGQNPEEATRRGYERHARKGEPPCEDCRKANAKYMREYKSRGRKVVEKLSSPPCGQDPEEATRRGYFHHKKRGEPPCEDCRKASAKYQRKYRGKERERVNGSVSLDAQPGQAGVS